ncbi:hypothetical protein EON63_21395 [archaeon]|nr:MAG: hypothetical protein EON63_21395 [archaeon]
MADEMQSESDPQVPIAANLLASLESDGLEPTNREDTLEQGQHDEVYVFLRQENVQLSFSVQNIILRFISAFRDTFSISKKVLYYGCMRVCACMCPLSVHTISPPIHTSHTLQTLYTMYTYTTHIIHPTYAYTHTHTHIHTYTYPHIRTYIYTHSHIYGPIFK